MECLKEKLKRIDGKGYKRYKEIEGIYNFGFFTLIVDHVQSDPFAPPSKLRIKISNNISKFPPSTFSSRSREVGLRDFLTRVIRNQTEIYSKRIKATGKSGIIEIVKPGQEILERNSVVFKNETIEVRFSVGLPSYGRKVSGKLAEDIFFTFIPEIVKNSLLYESIDEKKLYIHIETNEDADFLREKLPSLGLISFIADGSILPRKSGVDDRPLKEGNVVPFKSSESLKIKVNLPNRGEIEGMGIRKGITLIAGGGYHGKSTLLNSIQLGIYNHIPGDGREFVVSNINCVKIRAEDGRRIEKVDISPFINNLPFGKETKSFSTENASGSTSQAANIIET
ncbi:ABC-ATPase domain-containing protein, partial [bacterium]|nr:ABC-ATPase domain-containing protein [bacterium]